MRNLLSLAACLVFLAVPKITWADKIPDTGHWKTYASTGNAVACRLVSSQRSLERVLNRAGWNTGAEPLPEIDWSRNIAIIVAPPKNRNLKYERKYVGLFSNDSTLTLRYKWTPLPSGTTTRTLEDGSQVTTMGSSHPTEPSVTVVSFLRSQLGQRRILCFW